MTPPSIEIVEAVAAAVDTPPADLDCILGDVVDPEALDRLVGPSPDGGDRPDVTVSFDYCGHTVTVSRSAGVVVA